MTSNISTAGSSGGPCDPAKKLALSYCRAGVGLSGAVRYVPRTSMLGWDLGLYAVGPDAAVSREKGVKGAESTADRARQPNGG